FFFSSRRRHTRFSRDWSSDVCSSDLETCCGAAVAGQGVVLQPGFLVKKHLEAGRLVELMPEYRSTELGVYAVYPTRKFVTPKVRSEERRVGKEGRGGWWRSTWK